MIYWKAPRPPVPSLSYARMKSMMKEVVEDYQTDLKNNIQENERYIKNIRRKYTKAFHSIVAFLPKLLSRLP
jgi:ribosomal protein S17E